MRRRTLGRLAGALALGAVTLGAVACGEPPVDLDVPARDEGQVMLDRAGVLAGSGVEERLRSFPGGRDVVALAYETERASRGEASRAGRLLLDAWDADVVLVAVARPGDFTSTVDDREDPADRQRFFGVEPADAFAVPGDLRERIVEEVVPPIAATNDWARVFDTAATELARGLAEAEATP